MKKVILPLILALFSFFDGFTQTISPAADEPYCSNQDYSFTITIDGKASNIGFINTIASPAGTVPPIWEGATTTFNYTAPGSGVVKNTTVKFTIRFYNDYRAQAFALSYSRNDSIKQTSTYLFKYIKSLPSGTVLGGSVDVPLCNTTPISISLSPQWYKTGSTSVYSPVDFQLINSYEYSVPIGWKVNNTTSLDTNTYILGAASATITPDPIHGNGGAIKVRAVGDCGDRGDISQKAIIRPNPIPTFITQKDYICPSSVKNVAINSIDAAASYTYTLSGENGVVFVENGLRSITTTATSVNLSFPANPVLDSVILSAKTNLACNATSDERQLVFYTGKYFPNKIRTLDNPNKYFYSGGVYSFSLIDSNMRDHRGDYYGIQNYEWTLSSNLQSINSTSNTNLLFITIPYVSNSQIINFTISGRWQDKCGLWSNTVRFVGKMKYAPDPTDPVATISNDKDANMLKSNYGFSLNISPNPVKDRVHISLVKGMTNGLIESSNLSHISLIKVYNITGTLLKMKKCQDSLSEDIDLSTLPSGSYFLEIYDGTIKQTKQIVLIR